MLQHEDANADACVWLACIDTLGLQPGAKQTKLWRVTRPPDVETLKLSRQLLRAAIFMRAIRAALSQKSANQTDQAQSAALKPVARRRPAPVALTGMFDPSKIGQRQNASARVVAWAKDLLPDTVEASAQNHDGEHAIDATPD